jgi:post-segregation antitoxin (ccd killing protein)
MARLKKNHSVTTIYLDAETIEAVKLLTEQGFNISHIAREAIKEKAKRVETIKSQL